MMNSFIYNLLRPLVIKWEVHNADIWRSKLDSGETITAVELKRSFPFILRCADSEYRVIDYDALVEFVKFDWTDSKKYKPEEFDCDNYGAEFDGKIKSFGNFTCARVHGYFSWVNGNHECICCYTTKGWILLEPQNNTFYPIEDYIKWGELSLM
jgi:hypothetical protein